MKNGGRLIDGKVFQRYLFVRIVEIPEKRCRGRISIQPTFNLRMFSQSQSIGQSLIRSTSWSICFQNKIKIKSINFDLKFKKKILKIDLGIQIGVCFQPKGDKKKRLRSVLECFVLIPQRLKLLA